MMPIVILRKLLILEVTQQPLRTIPMVNYATLTDARGNSIYFTYDDSGNLSTATNPLGGVDTYTYDTVGRVATHKDAKGNTTSYTYDDLDRLTKVNYPDGSTKTFTYDCCTLSSVTDSNGTLSFRIR